MSKKEKLYEGKEETVKSGGRQRGEWEGTERCRQTEPDKVRPPLFDASQPCQQGKILARPAIVKGVEGIKQAQGQKTQRSTDVRHEMKDLRQTQVYDTHQRAKHLGCNLTDETIPCHVKGLASLSLLSKRPKINLL